MTHPAKPRTLVACLALVTAFAIGGSGARSRQATPPQRTPTEVLGGEKRYRVHVSTDKPVYRLGEKVFVRGVILEARSHRPLEGYRPTATVKIKGPKGETVAQGSAQAKDSVIGFGWQISDGLGGGEYKVELSFPNDGLPPAVRKFDIRAYRPPRLKSQIVFVRDGYGPSDTVQATLHTERAEGGIPNGAKVTVTARVDGTEVHRSTTTIDDKGNCSAQFELPAEIDRGDGTLAFAIEDGGVVETATKTIPILLQTLDLTIYPEGGELVAGLPNRVYVQALTPSKKPADIEAVVVGPGGREVARFATEHEGRGRFEFTPQAGERYLLKIGKPTGIQTAFPLPEVKAEGVVLRSVQEVVDNGEQVKLRVGSATPRAVLITVSKGEKDLGSTRVVFADGKQGGTVPTGTLVEREITIPWEADGVLIVTVWSEEGTPLAERLIFRDPARGLKVSVSSNEKSYGPGGEVKLTIKTTTVQGVPVPAMVGLTVTDDSVLEMIEKREHAPRLPVMVFLEDEVRDLADAHVYLDRKNPKAPLAVDLLLGTQGWRRFAYVNGPQFIAQHGDRGRRALVHQTRSMKQLVEALQRQEKRRKQALKKQRERNRRSARRSRSRARGGMGAKAAPGMVAKAPALPNMAPRAALEDAAPPIMAPRAPRREARPQPAKRAGRAKPKPSPKPRAAAAPQDVKKRAKALQVASEHDAQEPLFRAVVRGQRVPNAMLWVREYAHKTRPERKQGDRIDFTETVFWHAGVKTNQKGIATVRFSLSDSVTAFRATADAFDAMGRIGTATTTVKSVEPFYIEPKIPLQVTSGDVIKLPVAVVNSTTAALRKGTLSAVAAPGIQIEGTGSLTVGAGQRKRRILKISVGSFVGESELVIEAVAGNYRDKVTRTLDVQPLGFPGSIAHGGMLEPDSTQTVTAELPQETVRGSITGQVTVYPTPLANLTQALTRLMREPNGCFEQTSSSNYPLVMAQQYFMSHRGVDPNLIERSRGMLDRGYKRLRSFECKKEGYEWFGEDPGHEALSAYGVMQFVDMARVMQVDEQMIDRTRQWLMARRDGQGRFTHTRRALHTWIVDPECHTSYITWALLESGGRGLEKEIATVRKMAAATKNSYVTALGANILTKAGDRDGANELMKRLVKKQGSDGSVLGATTSIVGSRGKSLIIETTALAALAWLRVPQFAGAVEKSIRFLINSSEGGRFGATQATVLALKAIVEYDKARAKPKKDGELQLLVDGQPVGGPLKFTDKTQGAISLDGLGEHLEPGRHTVAIRMTGGSSMPYSVAIRYNTLQPVSSSESRVFLSTTLRDRKLTEGDITEVEVVVTNTTGTPLPTPVAIIGIPGGLEVRHDQLKELKKAKRIAAYEVRGRDVVLYWRELAPRQTVKLPLSVVAAVPGTYTGAASRAYEYYADEYKQWTAGMKVEIAPKR